MGFLGGQAFRPHDKCNILNYNDIFIDISITHSIKKARNYFGVLPITTVMQRHLYLYIALLLGAMTACSKEGSGPMSASGLSPDGNATQTALTIQDEKQLIGGPSAQGRVGDILMANEKIRVIIQQPGKYPGISSFGGNIIDADLTRPSGRAGSDNFGSMVPLINVEWTTNTLSAEVVSSGQDQPTIVRTHSIIDTYDYLDIDFIEPIAKNLAGTSLYYSPRFDDMSNPFAIFDLQQMDVNVTTDYRLDPGSNYVTITTTLRNTGATDVSMPVGDFVNGSGQLQLLIPGLGFAPALIKQLPGDTPALFYVGMPGVEVSYGYFYDFKQFLDPTKVVPTRFKTGSLSYSGVTGTLLGEDFTKIFPIGGSRNTQINFAVPAHGERTITRYFVVGDGSAGSLLDQGLQILQLPTHRVSGVVTNAQGAAMPNVTVAVLNADGNAVVTYRSDTGGRFSGLLSTGETQLSQAFGTGKYSITVYSPGYAAANADGSAARASGICTPDTVDMKNNDIEGVHCVLGGSGVLQLGGVVDDSTGRMTPARVTVVGFDAAIDPEKVDRFFDAIIYDFPYGIVDVQYLNARGGLGLTDSNSIRLSPGQYILTFSRGPEYAMVTRPITIADGQVLAVEPIALKRVVTTPGLISADFHVHAIRSPDSTVPMEIRVLQAVAEGLDVLHSSDHDYLADYAPVVRDMVARGLIPDNALQTIVGNEISPNSLGHFIAFPLVADPLAVNGGALDWSLSPADTIGPAPDYTLTVPEIIAAARKAPGPAEKVVQLNHIADTSTSLPMICGWITTTAYKDGFGVPPLSTYTDPVTQRMNAQPQSMPLSLDDSPLISVDFDTVELVVGPELSHNHLQESAMPVWFNLLNLGVLATATSDSDTHTSYGAPVGLPRNYIQSTVDPRDGLGSDYQAIDPEHYAAPINKHHLTISAGPVVTMTAVGEDGATVGIGDVVSGKRIRLHVEVSAPSWAWFDTIEIYANTEPLPADDDGISPLKGAASDPKSFAASYHMPKYVYQPTQVYRLSDGTLKTWKEENGAITATLDLTIEAKKDTWVVAFAHGTRETKGFKSLFPLAPHVVKEKNPEPMTAPFTLDSFYTHPALDAPAWALTNPIFIDVDGDADNDGNLFEALYVQDGSSPVRKR